MRTAIVMWIAIDLNAKGISSIGYIVLTMAMIIAIIQDINQIKELEKK